MVERLRVSFCRARHTAHIQNAGPHLMHTSINETERSIKRTRVNTGIFEFVTSFFVSGASKEIGGLKNSYKIKNPEAKKTNWRSCKGNLKNLMNTLIIREV